MSSFDDDFIERTLARRPLTSPEREALASARASMARGEFTAAKGSRHFAMELVAAGAVAVLVIGLILALAHPAPKSPLPATTHPTASPNATPTVAPTPSPSPSAQPVPSGFQPESLTAISEDDFWVLGASGCASSGCASEILHTVDGGRSFHAIQVPPRYVLTGNESTPGPPTVTDIRFADASDGWAFGNTLWATHDAGATWSQINFGNHLLGVLQLEPGANGYVYAVFEICTNPTTAAGCTYPVMRSRANTNTWSVIAPPGNPVGRPSIGVHGNTLWVMYFDRSTGLEWRSSDDGLYWVRGTMPCEPDLGGVFDPVSSSVIWAFCATGNAGSPSVSTNGGVTWSSAGGSGLFSNGAMVAALSAQHAFVGGGGSGLSITDNSGTTYQPIAELDGASWAGFTDSAVGYVITQNPNTEATRLWRTTNGGATWSLISFP